MAYSQGRSNWERLRVGGSGIGMRSEEVNHFAKTWVGPPPERLKPLLSSTYRDVGSP